MKKVGCQQIGVPFLKAPLVKQHMNSVARANAHVRAAFRTNIEMLPQFVGQQHGFTRVAFNIKTVGRLRLSARPQNPRFFQRV